MSWAERLRRRWQVYRADAIEPRLFLLVYLRAAGDWVVAVTAAANLVIGLLPVAFVVASSVLIGRAPAAVRAGIGTPEWTALLTAFLIASGLFAAQQVLTPVQGWLAQLIKHRIDGYVHDRVIDAVLRSTGIGPLEDDACLARLHEATETLLTRYRTPGDAGAGMLALLVRYSRLVGFGVVLAVAFSWWAAVALCAATMLFRFGHRGGLRMYMRLWPRVVGHRREREYFRSLGLGAAAGKEMRVFGLTGWVADRYRASSIAALRPLWRERRRTNVHRFLWFTAVGLLVACSVLAAMLASAAQADLSLTRLILGIQATIGAILLGEFYHEADSATQFGMLSVRALDDFERMVANHVMADVSGSAADAAGLPARTIRFADVSFSYRGSDRPVLDGLELTLRAGECTALVGLNGAGKTTLVKLLARLYEPTGGTLLVDGRDLREFGIDSWRRQLGVIFQDFNRYELSVTDNIAFGAIERPVDQRAVHAAAVRAGIAASIAELPAGYQTVLDSSYDNGTQLSGGQWQRVAIARALYAVDAGARVLVLDEPTAALDVRAEAAFFDEFAELTRGVTTLLISHRFSSVRRADRIIVLADGRVIEDGTHQSLLARGARYAELFTMQAERFTTGLGDGDGDSEGNGNGDGDGRESARGDDRSHRDGAPGDGGLRERDGAAPGTGR